MISSTNFGSALLAVIIAGGTAMTASAATVETRKVRDWELSAYTNDETGKFSHCGLYAYYRNEVLLILSLEPNGDMTIGFTSDNFKFEPKVQVPAKVAVDGRVIGEQGYTVDEQHVNVFVGDSPRIMRRLKRGLRVTVDFGHEQYRFDLKNSSAGLAEIQACVKQHVRAGTTSKPAATAEPEPEAAAAETNTPSLEERLEGSILAANLLARLGIDGWRLVDKSAAPDWAASHEIYWSGRDILGTVQVIRAEERGSDLQTIREAILGDDASNCGGAFMSGTTEGTTNEGKSRHFYTSCTATSSDWRAYYSVVPRPAGGHIVYTSAALGEHLAKADDVGLRISRVAHDVVQERGAP